MELTVTAPAGKTSVEKVVVVVHGVGDQTRFATLQQTLSQFCQYHGSEAGVPLGNFHVTGKPALILPQAYPAELQKFAFAEVYWADIPRRIATEYSLENVQPWVRTIVSRVRMGELASRKLSEADQRMIEQVLGEMLRTIDILEWLCFVADKLGVFSFDLKKILVDYVDDVQIVAEFRTEGEEIGAAFEKQMAAVAQAYPGAEIYLVAHSEGTVVALLGLLSALCGSKASSWIDNVRGFMTFGSPIDKHLILWPELFSSFTSPCRRPAKPIDWRNYYDFGDPVGFELDTAREKLAEPAWAGVFDFPPDHDHGFARYPLPGKAHVDYWKDPEVFGHFIQNVVYKKEKIKPEPTGKSYMEPPASKPLSRAISWGGPYLGAFALLFCAVLLLYNTAAGAIQVRVDTNLSAALFRSVNEDLSKTSSTVAAITCLLAGLTVLARIPRLTGLWRWRLLGFAIFLVSIVASRFFSCVPFFQSDFRGCFVDKTIAGVFHFSLAGTAILVLLGVYLVSRLEPEWGTQALLIPGGIGVGYVLYRYFMLQQGGAVSFRQLWPVFVAAAIFLYLWWLVALIFDLVFVWHRYIRYSGEGRYLRLPQKQSLEVPRMATS